MWTVWSKNLTVWTKSWRCDQKLMVWSRHFWCEQTSIFWKLCDHTVWCDHFSCFFLKFRLHLVSWVLNLPRREYEYTELSLLHRLLLQPVMSAQYTQLPDDTFTADANQHLAGEWQLLWDGKHLLLRCAVNTIGVVFACPDLFGGTTELWWWWCLLFVLAETKKRSRAPYIPWGRYVP